MTLLKIMFPHSVSFHYFSFFFFYHSITCQEKGALIILGLLFRESTHAGVGLYQLISQHYHFKNDLHKDSTLITQWVN